MPVLIDRYRPASGLPVDQYGHFCNFCYINVKKSKVLGTSQTQPCGSPWTLRMTLRPNLRFYSIRQVY